MSTNPKLLKNTKNYPYRSMDPFTQARWLYKARTQLGIKTTFDAVYKSMVTFFEKEAEERYKADSQNASKEDSGRDSILDKET